LGDLPELTARLAQIDEVDRQLVVRVAYLNEKVDRLCGRRSRHRVTAGDALQSTQSAGETVTLTATQTGVSISRVREYLRAVTETQEGTWQPGGSS
jgi:hypothetical protein